MPPLSFALPPRHKAFGRGSLCFQRLQVELFVLTFLSINVLREIFQKVIQITFSLQFQNTATEMVNYYVQQTVDKRYPQFVRRKNRYIIKSQTSTCHQYYARFLFCLLAWTQGFLRNALSASKECYCWRPHLHMHVWIEKVTEQVKEIKMVDKV